MFPNQPEQTPPQTPPQEPTPQPQWPAPQPQWPPQSQTPYSPTPLPSDYLNQIAPQAPKKPAFSFGLKQIIIIGIALIVLVCALALIVGAVAGGQKDPLQRLSARLTATETIATDAQTNLKSSKLRSLNSNLKLYLTNTNRDIAEPLLKSGVDIKKLNKSIVAKESTKALSGRLEDARLNAVFDRTYAREMAYELGITMTLMSEIYNSTGSASLKTFLKSAYDSLKPTQESFANFNAAQ